MRQEYVLENEVCIITYNESIDWEFMQKNVIIDEKYINASKLMILNMEFVPFMDSIGIGELVRVNNAINSKGKKLCISGLNSNLKKVFSISEMDTIFPIFDSVNEARSYYLF